jgi:hypothetical protein
MEREILQVLAEQRQEINGLRDYREKADKVFQDLAQLLNGQPEARPGSLVDALTALFQ